MVVFLRFHDEGSSLIQTRPRKYAQSVTLVQAPGGRFLFEGSPSLSNSVNYGIFYIDLTPSTRIDFSKCVDADSLEDQTVWYVENLSLDEAATSFDHVRPTHMYLRARSQSEMDDILCDIFDQSDADHD